MWEIFKFEIKYRAKRPATYIYFAILFLMAFVSVTTDVIQIGGGAGQVKENAPVTISTMMAILTAIPGLLLVAGIMGVPVMRDFEHKTSSMIFSTPINKYQYLFGRFFGSFLTAIFVFSGMLFGFMLGYKTGFLGWVEEDKLLPYNLWHFLHPFLAITMTNLIIMSGFFFAGGTLSKKMLVVFTQGAVFLVAYLISFSFMGDLDNKNIAALFDPLGIGLISHVTQYWTVAEQNAQTIPISGTFLWNRLIWIGLSVLSFVFTIWKFSFSSSSKSKKKIKKENKQEVAVINPAQIKIPTVTQHTGFETHVKQMFDLSFFYFKWVVKQVPFIAFVLMGMGLLFSNAINWNKMYGVKTLPTTYSMLELISTFNLFFIIIIVSYTGTLIWKERKVKMNLIYDAMPYPNFVTLGAKFLGMVYIFIVLLLVLMLSGMMVQMFNGYTNFEIALYVETLFSETLFFLLLFTFLGFFIQVIVNHEYLGYAAFVVFFVASLVVNELGFEHSMFHFGDSNLGRYSDMNGFGHYVPGFSWFNVYWFGLALFLFVITLLFSVRGAESVMKVRLRMTKLRLSKPLITFAILSLMTFGLSGCYIYYNTNVQNEYHNSEEQEAFQGDYEKLLKKYESVPQLKIVDVNVKVDIRPEDRDFKASGTYILKNKTQAPISEIHIQYNPEPNITNTVEFKNKAGIKEAFEDYKFYIYEFENPVQPGDSIQMDFTTDFTTKGFVEGGSNTEILHNGTFFNNTYFPTFGYDRNLELSRDKTRKEQDLPERERMLERDDPKGLAQNLITDDADRINFEITISTAPNQIAIAPGYLQKEWEENGRKYFHYKMDKPIMAFYSIVSAQYEVLKDKWKAQDGSQEVNLEIYYHKGHDVNLDRMIKSMKKSLDYYTTNFSPYQYRQLRIMEFPRYRGFAQSFANTVPFSEQLGFMSDIKEDDIDIAFYVTAHEIGHQWWGHQLTEANVKGNAMLSETLSQYSALMVMKKEYSEAMMQKFLKREMNRYLRGRKTESKKEQPLELVESQGYIHYRKGSVIMYALQDYISEDSVNLALRRCLKDWAGKENPYITSADLLKYFKEVTPDSLQYVIKDMFETITLFENKTEEAKVEKVGEKFKVDLSISTIKYRADSLGNEQKIPINDWIDIGVLGKDENGKDKILYLKKHKIDQEKMNFTITVDEKPTKAGIDPILKLIDRNPDDNVSNLQ